MTFIPVVSALIVIATHQYLSSRQLCYILLMGQGVVTHCYITQADNNVLVSNQPLPVLYNPALKVDRAIAQRLHFAVEQVQVCGNKRSTHYRFVQDIG
jgi:hypothetical protein